jgi:hypothetical protein
VVDNGLVPVVEAAAALGVARRTLNRRLQAGTLPTGAWQEASGGRRRLVDVEACRAALAARNGGDTSARPLEAAAEGTHDVGLEPLLESLADAVSERLAQRGAHELAQAEQLVRRVARDLNDLSAQRAELRARERELADQRAALAKLAEDHRSAKAAYLRREAELAVALRQRAPRPAPG